MQTEQAKTSNSVTTISGTVTYQSSSKNFQGTISGGNLATGQYLVKVTMPGYLTQQYPGIVTVSSANQTITLPSLSLVTGDINNDGQLDVTDYNLISNCYGSKQTTSSCTKPPSTQSQGADLNDDGTVNGVDYNLFLRDISVQQGG